MNALSPETYAALQQKLAALRPPIATTQPQTIQPAPIGTIAPAAGLPASTNVAGAAPVAINASGGKGKPAQTNAAQTNAIAGQESGQAANNAAATADQLGASTDQQGQLPAPSSLDQFSQYCASGAPLGGAP